MSLNLVRYRLGTPRSSASVARKARESQRQYRNMMDVLLLVASASPRDLS